MMNKKIILCILILTAIILAGCTQNSKLQQNTQNQVSGYNVLDVNNIATDPTAYTGKITVRGGVSFAYPDKNSFVIIDMKEYNQCGVVTCAINHLTVTYNKQLPNVKDRVQITGELVKTTNGYVLNADDVKIQ